MQLVLTNRFQRDEPPVNDGLMPPVGGRSPFNASRFGFCTNLAGAMCCLAVCLSLPEGLAGLTDRSFSSINRQKLLYRGFRMEI